LGLEASHIQNTEERDWLYKEMEEFSPPGNIADTQKLALESLLKAELFEHTIHTKFPGAKRFSLEGAESTIVALENILLTTSELGVEEVTIGMAHRGRLNVLTHILGKPYHAIFSEFAGVSSIPLGVPGSGDVKYHLGFSKSRTLKNGKNIKLILMPNPSHLEAVNPVVMGRTRAKQDLKGDTQRKSILPLLIHGDAAVAGQGIVAECLAMANLEGYTVGGTIHIVINNQVGFTAISKDTKSSTYSTDVGKMIEAPIFHVNGNEIESVIKVAVIISKYRQKYGKDVLLEIICYRKYGHNEGDEPMFTQPVMYNKIKQMSLTSVIYGQELLRGNIISPNFEDAKRNEIKAILETEFEKSKTYKPTKAVWLEGRWSHIKLL
jgi:2-oxoglutarate dehydrogenase E1 component